MKKPWVIEIFPLIRPTSNVVLAILLRLPIHPNIITGFSLASGLAASAILFFVSEKSAILPALLLILSYIFDNCDGEIARKKGLTSEFGRRFDNLSDWLIHACFFLALGHAWYTVTGKPWWSWMGWAAAAGSTINYFLTLIYELVDPETVSEQQAGVTLPNKPYEWFIFGFRELARADFCFLVLILAVFDLHWLLLPAATVGAQVYWLMQFHSVARRFRV